MASNSNLAMTREEIIDLELEPRIFTAVEASGRMFIESRKKSGLLEVISRNGVIMKIEAKDL